MRQRIVLIIGSAPNAIMCQSWPKDRVSDIVAINNAWAVREDWDFLIMPDDFPSDRHPQSVRPGQTIVTSQDYVPANNAFGGVFYAGGTMAFTAGYWALQALKPQVLAFLGCDMIYASAGKTHFYGTGAPDPLRDDPSLRSLEAKSARLMLHARQQNCACVRLSTGDSRLIFPSAEYEALRDLPLLGPAAPNPGFDLAKQREDVLGYFAETGRYWEDPLTMDLAELDAIDALWLDAARPAQDVPDAPRRISRPAVL